MNTLLLVYVMLAHEHKPPTHPKFFTMYRSEKACTVSAERYMEENKKGIMLINAKCVDPHNPNLVPYLRDVTEIEAIVEKEA